MTIVSLNTESASIQELSPDQLDQVAAGHPNIFPAAFIVATALGVVGTMIAGVLGSIFRGE
jgi:hypothetical protein